jgi:tetratricopeptide (TPR) repeat protein
MAKKSKAWLSYVLIGALVLSLAGCSQIFGSSHKSSKPDASTTAIDTVLAGLSAKLVSEASFTQAQADSVVASAKSAVTVANADGNALEAAIPAALAGAEAGLGSAELNLSQALRIGGVNTIVTTFVTSINGQFAATSRTILSFRALSINAQVVADLLARISKAAVTNLKDTGIETASLGSTAASVVGNMIGSLGGAGVNKALVSEALTQITQNAVASLKVAGLSEAEALATAVQAVTKGAVAAVTTVSVSGVEVADYATLTGNITQGAASALGQIADDSAGISKLAGAVAAGSSEGIVSISQDLDGSTLASMVQAATSGTTTGALTNSAIDLSSASDSISLIGAITTSTTQTLAGASSLDQSAIQQSVTIGASAAAQTTGLRALSDADLTAAIKLVDKNGAAAATASATDISNGVALGKNAPPTVAVGADQTGIKVDATVNVTATASDDHDTTLSYKWSFAGKPTGSMASLSGAATLAASFKADLAGKYLLSFKATDSLGSVTEAFVSVSVESDTSSATYQGKTAAQWLSDATTMEDTGEQDQARQDLLAILGHFPESSIFGEVNLRLAWVYNDMDMSKLAKPKYEAALGYTSAAEKIGIWTRLSYANYLTWTISPKELTRAKALLNEIIAAQAGTKWEADALQILAGSIRAGGSDTETDASIAMLNNQVLVHPKLSASTKFWAHQNLGWAYTQKKQWALANAEFTGLAELATATLEADETTTNAKLKFEAARHLWWFLDTADNDSASGYSQSANGLAMMKGKAADTSLDPAFRLILAQMASNLLIWNNGSKPATYNEAIALLSDTLSATATATDANTRTQRLWTYLYLGYAYQQLQDVQSVTTEKQGSIASATTNFQKAQEGWGTWYGEVAAAYAMIEAAGNYHWNYSTSGHNDTALALLSTVIGGYPAELDQAPLPNAYFRQGEIYKDIGNNLKNQSGKDYAASFNRAIASFGQVSRSLYPTVDSTRWYFVQALRQIGDCYVGLKNYTTAQSYFNKDLADASVPSSEKAWAQLSLAECYGQLALQMVQEGKFDASLAYYDSTVAPAFELVQGYGSSINNGRSSCQGYLRQAQVLRDAGRTMHYDMDAEKSIWSQALSLAVPIFQKITPTAYPSLGDSGWEFSEAFRNLADCQLQLGSYADGRASLNQALTLVTNGTISDQSYWDISKDLAMSYRREAENVEQSGDSAARVAAGATKIALEEKAIAQFDILLSEWADKPGTSDQANTLGWGLQDYAWSILDIGYALGWGDDYSAADVTKLDGLTQDMAALWTKATSSPWKDANSGANRACIARTEGQWYREQGNWRNIQDRVSKRPYLDKALSFYESAINNAGAEEDTLADCKQGEVWIYLELARDSSILDTSARIGDFNKAIDLTNALIVDPDVDINYSANAAVNLSQAYRDLHGLNSEDSSQLGGLGILGLNADGNSPDDWKSVVQYYVKAIADHSDNYSQLNYKWEYQEAWRLMHQIDPDNYSETIPGI